MRNIECDVVVIGSGFGGAVAAHVLQGAGRQVTVVERGPWPVHPAVSGAPRSLADLDPFYNLRRAFAHARASGGLPGPPANVGGPSLYFAAVSSRFREADFEPASEIVADSGANWPYRYGDLEPYYSEAETLLQIAGSGQGGSTEPYRSRPYPQTVLPLTAPAQRLHDAAVRLGLHPFRLPLAINYQRDNGRAACTACPYCDGFPCLIGAKNDVAAHLLPSLLRGGLRVDANTVVTRLLARGDRVAAVEARHTRTGEVLRYHAQTVILAAGALASPALLLASGLQRLNPAGDLVGRFLMRHCNAHVFGVFPRAVDTTREFHKQIGIDDFYFGHEQIARPHGKLGSIQQMATPWVALLLVPRRLGRLFAPVVHRMTGFLVIAEDQPRRENRVEHDAARPDAWGGPGMRVSYRNSRRDLAARAALIRQAKGVLREAGAPLHIVFPIRTFSHAVGTLRMGRDPDNSVLDEYGRFRGIENLYVTDGSIMPTSAGMNPSLTIAANSLRTAHHVAGTNPSARAAEGVYVPSTATRARNRRTELPVRPGD